jgi:CTP-dependent riboflavin kinase
VIEELRGRVQAGTGKASHWLALPNDAYVRKLGTPIFPGSLNLALAHNFDWQSPAYQQHIIWFGREELGAERDILLLPCVLQNLDGQAAHLWTTTIGARERPDPWVVELIAAVGLRESYGLSDGDEVVVEIPVGS